MMVTTQELWNLLQEGNDITITSHVHLDGDAIGTFLPMHHVLRPFCKKTSVLIDDHIPECFSVLPGAKEITKPGEGMELKLFLCMNQRMSTVSACARVVQTSTGR